jgi:hypothetical protein
MYDSLDQYTLSQPCYGVSATHCREPVTFRTSTLWPCYLVLLAPIAGTVCTDVTSFPFVIEFGSFPLSDHDPYLSPHPCTLQNYLCNVAE